LTIDKKSIFELNKKSLFDDLKEIKDSNDLPIVDLFKFLPFPRELPTFYIKISKPIRYFYTFFEICNFPSNSFLFSRFSIDVILRKPHNTPTELKKDFDLLVSNTRNFFGSDSDIYEQISTLEVFFLDLLLLFFLFIHTFVFGWLRLESFSKDV
jgi:hypothetical protein